MCDFSSISKSCCVPGYEPNENSCKDCFDLPTSNRYKNGPDNTCGLPTCTGGPTIAPCGSESCVGRGMGGVTCQKQICPNPTKELDCLAVDCRKPDGTRCSGGGETCLRDEINKKDYASKFKYTDFSKYTFNKSKYIPSSYLPGDGADYLQGYKSKIYPEESGLGGCGSYNCGLSSLDYVLQKLTTPINFMPNVSQGFVSGQPRQNSTGAWEVGCTTPRDYSSFSKFEIPPRASNKRPGVDWCGANDCVAKLTKKSGQRQQGGSNCGAPDCGAGGSIKTRRGCGAPDCKYNQGSPGYRSPDFDAGSVAESKRGCGAPDCKYNQKRRGCGAPGCKYSKQANDTCPNPCEDPDHPMNINRYPKEGTDTVSCNSLECPFVSKQNAGVGNACDNPECPFTKQGKIECADKTCPHAKEFVICADCGGIVLDAEQQEQVAQAIAKETASAQYASTGVKTSVEVEKIRGNQETRASTKKPRKSSILNRTSIKGNGDQLPLPMLDKGGRDDRSIKSFRASEEPFREKKRRRTEADYSYPGVILGHADCHKRKKRIPGNMGWLWNIRPSVGDPDLWRGYKPGAIAKTVYKRIQKHRRELGIYNPSDIIKKRKSKTSTRALSDKNKRVISVKKKDGNYMVTMSPVKDPQHRHEFESPYVDCTPVQFRIIKPPKPQIEPQETVDPENPCACERPVEQDMQTVDSSDLSEIDFNFSPPAALPTKAMKKKKLKITKETQYESTDLKYKSKASTPKSDKSRKGKKKKKKKKE